MKWPLPPWPLSAPTLIPSIPLAEMRLRVAAVRPPTVVFVAFDVIRTPASALPCATVPDGSVPMKHPSMTASATPSTRIPALPRLITRPRMTEPSAPAPLRPRTRESKALPVPVPSISIRRTAFVPCSGGLVLGLAPLCE